MPSTLAHRGIRATVPEVPTAAGHTAQGGVPTAVPSAIVPLNPATIATYAPAGVVPGLTSWIGVPAGTTAASPAPSTGPVPPTVRAAAGPRARAGRGRRSAYAAGGDGRWCRAQPRPAPARAVPVT